MKKWYKSKTIWYNIAVSFVAIGNEMMPVLGVMEGAAAEELRAWLVLLLAVGNTILRTVTKTKVQL